METFEPSWHSAIFIDTPNTSHICSQNTSQCQDLRTLPPIQIGASLFINSKEATKTKKMDPMLGSDIAWIGCI